MKQLFIFLYFFFSIHLVLAQGNEFSLCEDSIRILQQTIISQESDTEKVFLNKKLSALLVQTLSKTNSNNYPFDSLKTIAVISPADKSFRIFNWEVSFSDGSISYFGIVQSYDKRKKQIRVTELFDQSFLLKKPENQLLDAANWYGAHYYKLIETKKKKKNYYTLLGANWSNPLLRKKVIDVIAVSSDGKIKFGEAIFQKNKTSNRRVVFQYASEISMSLRYDATKKQILFDHLVPRSPELKEQYEFYGPDMSIDAFEFKKGKWQLIEDVDARNEKRK